MASCSIQDLTIPVRESATPSLDRLNGNTHISPFGIDWRPCLHSRFGISGVPVRLSKSGAPVRPCLDCMSWYSTSIWNGLRSSSYTRVQLKLVCGFIANTSSSTMSQKSFQTLRQLDVLLPLLYVCPSTWNSLHVRLNLTYSLSLIGSIAVNMSVCSGPVHVIPVISQ